MAKRIPYRRRREKKTDYKLRLGLLKSGKNRLVIRKFNNSTIGQIIKYEKNGDKTLVAVNSMVLKKFGWKGHYGNLPAAYLSGLLLGVKMNKMSIKEAVLDMGLQKSTKGNRIYAFLKGVVDAGISVPHSEDVLPSEDRIMGKHINDEVTKDFESVKEKILKTKV
ncbi:MAG: 50S ribosomal protein L18 [Candidatus Aenigmarchaeota archaeon]|nr:50S ribosomal protein L18 [Candidatus Aenigmarchaeota archaeon]